MLLDNDLGQHAVLHVVLYIIYFLSGKIENCTYLKTAVWWKICTFYTYDRYVSWNIGALAAFKVAQFE